MANDRDCENCKHHREVRKNGKFYRFCESWDCGFEPKEPVRNPDQLDCISRQAVLNLLENTNNGWIIDKVLQLPPVNPQKPICPSAGVDCEDCPAYEKKSEWEHDHEILRAYSDGASEVLDKIKAEIDEQYDRVHPYDISCAEGLEMALNIIDKYAEEDKA